MIRKSGNRFSLATNAERVCAEIMLNQKGAKLYSMTMRGGGRCAAPVTIVVQISRAMPI